MFASFWLCSKCTIRLKCRMQNNFHSSSWSLSVGMFTLKIWLHRQYWTSWSSWFGKLCGRPELWACSSCPMNFTWGCRVFREHLFLVLVWKWHYSVSICVLRLWGLISQKWEGMSRPNISLTWWTLQLVTFELHISPVLIFLDTSSLDTKRKYKLKRASVR